MHEESLDISPLFTGLTRPPMILGVTMDYLAVSGLISLCSFIMFDSPLYLILYIPLHIFGVIACAIDPNIFRLLAKKFECLPTANKKIWRCQSYEPF